MSLENTEANENTENSETSENSWSRYLDTPSENLDGSGSPGDRELTALQTAEAIDVMAWVSEQLEEQKIFSLSDVAKEMSDQELSQLADNPEKKLPLDPRVARAERIFSKCIDVLAQHPGDAAGALIELGDCLPKWIEETRDAPGAEAANEIAEIGLEDSSSIHGTSGFASFPN